jgi:hypothetical protein
VRIVEGDIIQTFRNFISAIVTHQVKKFMGRDALLILLDEFDVIKDKEGIGSLIKSLSSNEVKFAICGIGHDLSDLVEDHASVERLLEEGALHVQPMQSHETKEIIHTAERLFKQEIVFAPSVVDQIAELSHGYPYFTQLLGKACVSKADQFNRTLVSSDIYEMVLDDIKSGEAFPTLERQYRQAIGNSRDRQVLLHFLADQPEASDNVGQVILKEARKDFEDLNIQHLDQLLPRLVDTKYGPVLRRDPVSQGIYEFINPVLRLYIRLRQF